MNRGVGDRPFISNYRTEDTQMKEIVDRLNDIELKLNRLTCTHERLQWESNIGGFSSRCRDCGMVTEYDTVDQWGAASREWTGSKKRAEVENLRNKLAYAEKELSEWEGRHFVLDFTSMV